LGRDEVALADGELKAATGSCMMMGKKCRMLAVIREMEGKNEEGI